MHIERSHNLGQAAAIAKIDTFLDDLMHRQFPGGVTVKDASKSWSANQLNFSFKAKKGFFGAAITGVIGVHDDSIVMDFEVPGLVSALVSEASIRDAIHKELDNLFPA